MNDKKPEKPVPGPHYCLNIEGTEHEWSEPTVTTEQIIELGDWDPGLGALLVNEKNEERTLKPGEVIELTPGRSFCRRVLLKRGFIEDRLELELRLLRSHYPAIERQGEWFRIPEYEAGASWEPIVLPVVFRKPTPYPGPPYGFWVPSGLRFKGELPAKYTEPAAEQPPFEGQWGFFSWRAADPAQWRPTIDVPKGANLLVWAQSFERRFKGGK